MAIIIQQIRDAINISNTDVDELSDAVIQSAIDRATSYITALLTQYSPPANITEIATLNYSVYLAYQSYADRVVQALPGSFTEGKWNPIGAEILRSTSDKLAGLRQVSDDTINLIKSNTRRPLAAPTFSSAGTKAIFRVGMHDNPPSDELE
ncbi:MAG: hypothetical protein ACYDG4_15195 [Desulfuromonadaceae bacterium]